MSFPSLMNIRIGYGMALLGTAIGCSSATTPDATSAPDGSASGSGGAGDTGGGASSGGSGASGKGGTAGKSASGGKSGAAGATGTGGATGGGGTSNVPPTGDWTNVTSNLAAMPSECGNMSWLSAKPDEDLLIAGIAQNGLWGSTDGGQTWAALGSGAGSAVIDNRMSWIVFDPADANQFWEAGIYGTGVYKTTDDGKTFAQLGDATHIDQVSVDLSDPARKVLLAGKHEAAQSLFRSENGGGTWTNVGTSLPAGTNCTFPLVIDAQTHLVGCWGSTGGVYRSTNAGTSWDQVSTGGGYRPALRASDQSLYWASGNNAGMVRSTDDGKTWTQVVGSGSILSYSPVELPDGRIATLGGNTVVASSDHGATWHPVSTALPYGDAGGIIYSVQQKAFFVWHATCGFNGPVPVPADAIMRFDYDYTKG